MLQCKEKILGSHTQTERESERQLSGNHKKRKKEKNAE